MNDSFILAARHTFLSVARRKLLFVLAAVGFTKECDIPNLAGANVQADHEIAAGEDHQESKDH